MEVQTFMLADRIDQVGPTRFDVRHAAVVSLSSSHETVFPVRAVIPALIVLRRESTLGDAPGTLRFNLVDEDGQAAGLPRQMLVHGMFPAGNRFLFLRMEVVFEFPRPGTYRLDITADEGLTGGVFHYSLEVLPPGATASEAHTAKHVPAINPGQVIVHQQDMGGWIRVHTDRAAGLPEDLPVFLSHALTGWFRQRPQYTLRSVVPVVRNGQTVELHAWYTLHVFPDISGQQARP